MRRIFSILMALLLVIGIIPFQAFALPNDPMSGDGTANNPYVITALNQLNAVRNDLNAHYKLGADVDASETANWVMGLALYLSATTETAITRSPVSSMERVMPSVI